MNLAISLKQELTFYLEDLSEYVRELREVYKNLTEDEAAQKLAFLESFEIKMRTGLKLILNSEEYFGILEEIRNPKAMLLRENKERYLAAISKDRGILDQGMLRELEKRLRAIPLVHATKNQELLKKNGILTPANLWKNRIKTSANAMDIALGLHFHYVFFAHGLALENFGQDYVAIENTAINNAVVSSVDVYKIVLIKNNLEGKGIVPTEKWFVALDDYTKQLFSGKDFFELKAAYILAYFNGEISTYDQFARQHFYSNDVFKAPAGEYPFLGEIKVLGNISANKIIK